MNIRRLREAEAAFLARFPEGFSDPGLAQIRKSHNVDKLAAFARANLTKATLSRPRTCADVLLKIVSRSSMVSRFEKPPFRAFLEGLDSKELRRLCDAFQKRLFGRKRQEGFDELVEQLARYKLARWSLVSAVPFYLAPSREVFVKPTTAKRIIVFLQADDLLYQARPSWTFYDGYRKLVIEIKQHVDVSLTPNNAAVTGFLMATM